MNFLHLRHRKLTEIVPVPEGLRELMADVTREVLRYQPENIEEFIADYLDAMLLTRELYTIANRTIEDILESSFQIIELLQNAGIDHSQSEAVVQVIQEEFQKHKGDLKENEILKECDIVKRLINECKLTIDQAKKASKIIENAWCHFYKCNKEHRLGIDPSVAHFEAVKKTLSIYKKSKPSCSEVNKSAKVLIAGFKGYHARKNGIDKTSLSLIPDANWRSPNFQKREQAAMKIQAWYRGLVVRRHFKKVIEAASKIQAGIKGYLARKELKRRLAEAEIEKTREKAAVVIQSFFRAFMIRKQLKIQQKAASIIQAQFRKFIVRQRLQEVQT